MKSELVHKYIFHGWMLEKDVSPHTYMFCSYFLFVFLFFKCWHRMATTLSFILLIFSRSLPPSTELIYLEKIIESVSYCKVQSSCKNSWAQFENWIFSVIRLGMNTNQRCFEDSEWIRHHFQHFVFTACALCVNVSVFTYF